MAYPPPSQTTGHTNDELQLDVHPAHHNALAQAVNDIVAELGPAPIPVEVLWDPTDWARFPVELLMSQEGAVTTWTKTVVTESGARRGRLQNNTGGLGGNTRVLHLLDGTSWVDSEVLGLWYMHDNPQPGGGQIGQCHRAGINPANSRPWAYIVWHDAVFGLDNIINIGVWSTDGATPPNQVTLASVDFTAPRITYKWPVLSSSRTSNVVTLVVPAGHRNVTGDVIVLAGGTAFDGTYPLTGSTLTTVTFALTGADNATGGRGELTNHFRHMPYFVRSRLVGTRFRLKVWPAYAGAGGEPDWSDPGAAYRWDDSGAVGPTLAGKCGYMGGHLNNTKKLDLGAMTARCLD